MFQSKNPQAAIKFLLKKNSAELFYRVQGEFLLGIFSSPALCDILLHLGESVLLNP